jgi:tRNA pseudouridine13 synthase
VKLKCQPDDFQVEEQIALRPGSGPFALYRVTKANLGTLEAVEAVAREWRLERRRLAFAGLKDRHALTRQYLTIDGGPRRGLSQTNLQVEYVGQCQRPVHASDIEGNRFEIVLREMSASDLARATAALRSAAADGLANYFDDQRFGSVGESGDFIARPWCLGDYERALWLALAEPNVHDRPAEREQKQHLRDRWGQWPELSRRLSRTSLAPVMSFLAASPRDFRRAISCVRQELRSLWLAAYQSHLWNQVLAELLKLVCRPVQLSLERIGGRAVPVYSQLDDAQRQQLLATRLPLPSARLHLAGNPLQPLYDRVLAAEGIELRQVRVKYPRDSFFSKGERSAVLVPTELTSAAAPDELYPDCRKLVLRFVLPRGAYATMLIKRITGIAVEAEDASGPE